MKQPAPTDFQGERLPQYLPGTPDGSAADVRARGMWRDGAWTLELSRRLVTGNPDDTSLDPARSYQTAVATFDHTGTMDRASHVIVLSFGQELSRYGFEEDTIGTTPIGFTAGLTGRGRPGNWEVRVDARASSGNNVVVQTDPDPTNYRFPILVSDAVNARDLDVSVRFKPLSGKVDQAAGLVWRYTDQNNYYVVRANALEDNVVLYKVVDGRREDLPLKGVGRTYGVDEEVARETWSSLRVAAIGSLFEVYLNGEKLYEVEDDALTGPGRAGLWTKADSVTAFDNLLIGVYAH
jgi:hypothetical protein